MTNAPMILGIVQKYNIEKIYKTLVYMIGSNIVKATRGNLESWENNKFIPLSEEVECKDITIIIEENMVKNKMGEQTLPIISIKYNGGKYIIDPGTIVIVTKDSFYQCGGLIDENDTPYSIRYKMYKE